MVVLSGKPTQGVPCGKFRRQLRALSPKVTDGTNGVSLSHGCKLARSRKEDGRRCAGAACDQPQTSAGNRCGTRTSTNRPRPSRECPVIRPGLLSLLERTAAANPHSRPDQVSYTAFPCSTPTRSARHCNQLFPAHRRWRRLARFSTPPANTLKKARALRSKPLFLARATCR